MDIVNLIHRNHSGEATEDERKALADWIAESPENKEDFEGLNVLFGYTDLPDIPHVTEEEFNQGYERLQAGMREWQRREARSRNLKRFGGALSAITLLFFVIYIYIAPADPVTTFRYSTEPMANVIADLEKQYNIEIVPESPAVLECPFTGVIFVSASIDDAFGAISKTTSLVFTAKVDGSFLVSGNGCQSDPVK